MPGFEICIAVPKGDIGTIWSSHVCLERRLNPSGWRRLNDRRGHAPKSSGPPPPDPVATRSFHLNNEGSPDVTVDNYTLVGEDNYQVLPGITLIQTPGHTPGHQSVLVHSEDGALCVAGDAACLIENLTGPVPPTVRVSAEESLQSIAKICAAADTILMNHDPEINSFQSSAFPQVPRAVTGIVGEHRGCGQVA